MLKIYENGAPEHPLMVRAPDWYIEHRYDGEDVLKFMIRDSHEAYKYIAEEVRITDGVNRYSVKKIDEHGGYVNVECALDLDDWREKFWKSFRTTNSTLKQVLDQIKPLAWSIVDAAGITKKATIEASEGKGLENVTAKDILNRAAEVYEAVFNFDTINKSIVVIDPKKYTPSGDYLTDELNLKSIGFVGNSSDLVTRLYAYGKKDSNGTPVTISSVNGGKEYIDNTQYSDRIISVGWSDERYTIPANLLSAAKKKLDTLSYPVRSYECDVRNMDENMYMYKVVTLVDRKRKTRVDHRVITYKEFPEAHYYDVITLSAVMPKIESSLKSIRAEVEEKVATVQQVSADAALEALNVLTGGNGGHVKIVLENGCPEAIQVTHSDGSITTANKDGMSRDDIPYLYLIKQGQVTVGQSTWQASISLPDSFSGKEISVLIGVMSVEPANPTDVVHKIKSSWSFDQESRVVTIIADCDMLSEEKELVDPLSVELSYFITGR